MDFVGGLPKSKGIDTILVVVDRLSKYAHFYPLIHPFIAKQVVELFAREIIRLHGIPQSIVSDRAPIFMSGFWKELFRLQGSKLHTVQPITLSPTAKLRWSTAVWSLIYDVLRVISQELGVGGYLG